MLYVRRDNLVTLFCKPPADNDRDVTTVLLKRVGNGERIRKAPNSQFVRPDSIP